MYHRIVIYLSLAAAVAAVLFFTLSPGESSSLAAAPAAATAALPQNLPHPVEATLVQLRSRVPSVAFYIHTVKIRENLWKIASRRGFSVHTLIGCNPHLTTYDVSANQQILVPSKSGTLHRLQPGDTWESVAGRYRIPVGTVREINSGVLSLRPGEFVFVPGARPDISLMNDGMRKRYELRALFTSPLGGRFSSLFGKRKHPVTGSHGFHGGLDIAVRTGTWVGAASPGIVTVAGDGVGHYGKAVFIDHQNGYETHYGHLSRIFVRPGQRVKARQLIAKSGSTGRVTGPHLHFTVKKNGVPQDPLKYIW